MAAAAILDNFEWPYLHNSSRSTYIARIARSSLLYSTAFLLQIRAIFTHKGLTHVHGRLANELRTWWEFSHVQHHHQQQHQ